MRAELILEVEHYGARWGLEGQRVFIEPVSALPGSLLQRLRAHRAALAPIVKVRVVLEGRGRMTRRELEGETGLDRDTVLEALGALHEAGILARTASDTKKTVQWAWHSKRAVVVRFGFGVGDGECQSPSGVSVICMSIGTRLAFTHLFFR